MMHFRARFSLLRSLLLYVAFVHETLPNAIGGEAEPYQSLSLNKGLYNSSDNVVVLNKTNFKRTVYGNERAWLVEFYNSWCGFCQNFAPVWKSFADDVYRWQDFVAIAALDCADEDNNPLCREYEIMHYPELRYFAPKDISTSLGAKVDKETSVDGLRRNLLTRLSTDLTRMSMEPQARQRDKWPNITPIRSSKLENVWEGIAGVAKYYILFFEETDSSLATEVILDLHDITSLVIRSVKSANDPLCRMYGIIRFPSLVIYSRDGKQTHLLIRFATRDGAINVIREFMKSKDEDLRALDMLDKATRRPVAENPANMEENIPRKRKSEDYLYQADLEAVLRFSLSHEIPMIKLIQGERMKALKNFTSVLASYFPMRRGNPMFLNTINFVVRSKELISGEDFGTLVTSTEEEMSPVYTEDKDWIGCKPSKIGLRGYPCGLWTLFHTLTVNFAEKAERHPDMEATLVLGAMHGYVKHFFGCTECSRHFVAMAEKRKIHEVKSADESVLWLWRAHNEVNERLSGDKSEDPEHRKIQYPSAEHCSACRDKNDEWNETEVLNYLKKKYSYSGIVYRGSTNQPVRQDSKTTKLRNERLTPIDNRLGFNKFGWDFTIFDISICVVLYVTSAAILVLVCIKFAVKRSRKRRMYVQSIVGKV